MVDQILLQALVCPQDHTKLQVFLLQGDKIDTEEGILFCNICKRIWTIIEGIPRFVTEASIDLYRDIEKLQEYKKLIIDVNTETFNYNIGLLQGWQSKPSKGWAYEEMQYWEDHYEKKLSDSSGLSKKSVTFNRLLPRQKHILSLLADNKGIKNVIEIGCGSAGTISNNPFFVKDRNYFGTDLSFNALRLAKKHLNGYFVLCDADNLPFIDEYFDLMLSFGVLHHMPEHEKAFMHLATKVKKERWVALHEKIKASDKIRNSMLLKTLKKLFFKAERRHSRDEYIDFEIFLRITNNGYEVYHLHHEYSIILSIMVNLLIDKMKINNRTLTLFLIRIDEFFIRLLAPHMEIFAPKGVLTILKRK